MLIIPLVAVFVAPLLKPREASHLTALAFLLPFFSILYCIFGGCPREILLMRFSPPIGDIYLNQDFIAHAFGLTICLVSAMVALFALPYMEHRFEEMELDKNVEFRRYIFIYNLYAASMLWLVYSGNLALLYVFMELMLISAFLLIYKYGYGNRRWVGLLYLVWCAIAGVLTLAGFVIMAFNNNTLALNAIMAGGKGVGMVAWAFIFGGMIIELPVVGPHIWLPWAHAEAPTPVSALLSPLTVGLAGYVLLRIALIDYSFIEAYRMPILGYAIFSSLRFLSIQADGFQAALSLFYGLTDGLYAGCARTWSLRASRDGYPVHVACLRQVNSVLICGRDYRGSSWST